MVALLFVVPGILDSISEKQKRPRHDLRDPPPLPRPPCSVTTESPARREYELPMGQFVAPLELGAEEVGEVQFWSNGVVICSRDGCIRYWSEDEAGCPLQIPTPGGQVIQIDLGWSGWNEIVILLADGSVHFANTKDRPLHSLVWEEIRIPGGAHEKVVGIALTSSFTGVVRVEIDVSRDCSRYRIFTGFHALNRTIDFLP